MDLMYHLPDHSGQAAEFVIDREAILARKSLEALKVRRKESA